MWPPCFPWWNHRQARRKVCSSYHRLQLKIPTEGEEMLLTEINHKQLCLKNKYIQPKLSHHRCALWLFQAEKDFNISYLLTTPGFKSFLQL